MKRQEWTTALCDFSNEDRDSVGLQTAKTRHLASTLSELPGRVERGRRVTRIATALFLAGERLMSYAPRRPRLWRLTCEEIEARRCLSAISFAPHVIFQSEDGNGQTVYTADVDGDGDIDVLSASDLDGTVVWHENTDAKGTFGEPQVIATGESGGGASASAYVADVDGDGDMDVLATFSKRINANLNTNKTAWYKNVDGTGTFGNERVITTDDNGLAHATDLDGDGDVDVLTRYFRADTISWYENTDGKGAFGGQQVISTGTGRARGAIAVDLDGDGDADVLSGSSGFGGSESKIVWHENSDGEGTFGEQHVITTELREMISPHAADLDGDGDLDVLSASREVWPSPDKIAWYENTDGMGAFGPQQIITTQAVRPTSIYTADVDGDSDMDVLSASSECDWNRFRFQCEGEGIAWYENTDGAGSFGEQQFITTEKVGAQSVHAADVDGDGDTDVLAAYLFWDSERVFLNRRIVWYENVSQEAGDANGDGQFNQLDIVQILQAAKYLTGQPATWSEGDWNGDGLFDQDDIVAALQTGNYLQGPDAARAVDAAFATIPG